MSDLPATLRVRAPAVAGRFYPASASQLRSDVKRYLGESPSTPAGDVHAIIAPHAGYIYSGPIAGTAFASLRGKRDQIDRVILLGPSHFVAFTGIAAPTNAAFATPLGEVELNHAMLERAMSLPFLHRFDEAHEREHGLEVQLPFLQETLNHFTIAPFVIGDCAAEDVARLIDSLWTDDRTLLVISSDLSHYLDYDEACNIDRATAHAIESLAPEAIAADQACGQRAIQGLLMCARKRDLRLITLDLRNSGDTAGTKDRVVGYGAWIAVKE